MVTKVQAARLATESGVTVLVAGGTTENVLVRAVNGEAVGTTISVQSHTDGEPEALDSVGPGGKAAAHIDEGAATALKRGRSLLPAGIVNVKGPFDRGDSVNIVGPEGKAVAAAWRTTARPISSGSRDAARRRSRRFWAITSATK